MVALHGLDNPKGNMLEVTVRVHEIVDEHMCEKNLDSGHPYPASLPLLPRDVSNIFSIYII